MTEVLAVIGLGYVGLPLAVALAKKWAANSSRCHNPHQVSFYTEEEMPEELTGTFDAVGPQAPELTMGMVVDACLKASPDAGTTATWCDAEFLEAQGVSPWGHMPLWIPPRGDSVGFHQRDVSSSIAAGLTFLPVEKTCKDTLAWYNGLEEDSRYRRIAGIEADREAEVLAAWHEQQG